MNGYGMCLNKKSVECQYHPKILQFDRGWFVDSYCTHQAFARTVQRTLSRWEVFSTYIKVPKPLPSLTRKHSSFKFMVGSPVSLWDGFLAGGKFETPFLNQQISRSSRMQLIHPQHKWGSQKSLLTGDNSPFNSCFLFVRYCCPSFLFTFWFTYWCRLNSFLNMFKSVVKLQICLGSIFTPKNVGEDKFHPIWRSRAYFFRMGWWKTTN